MSRRAAEQEEAEVGDDDLELCVNCGGVMAEDDGIEYCPSCDTSVDFFGDDDGY